MNILIVCLGNICRSPLAEGILQDMADKAGLPWKIDSAGTNGYHSGEAPHQFSIKVAAENGIDISSQRSRIFVREDMSRFDRIYAMAADVLEEMKSIAGRSFEEQKTCLFLEELYPGKNRDVPDPWYGPETGYREVFALISQASKKIISKYGVTAVQ